MDILIIAGLIVIAIILLLVELFIIPGISLAGILGGVSLILANYYAFAHLGNAAGYITLAISAITCLGSLILFMRSKTLDRVALKEDIRSTVGRNGDAKVAIGDKGTATTRLALIGYADFNGQIVEVKSADGFLNEKTRVTVVRIADGVILVERDLSPS